MNEYMHTRARERLSIVPIDNRSNRLIISYTSKDSQW